MSQAPSGLNGVTGPLIAKTLMTIKRESTAAYRSGQRDNDGHFKASVRVIGRLRLSARVHRNGVEEISVSIADAPNSQPLELPAATVALVIDIHRHEFGITLEKALDASEANGDLAWVVLRPQVDGHSQSRLL